MDFMVDKPLLDRRYAAIGDKSPLFYDEPLHLVKGEGVWVYDSGGKKYLDAYNNVPHVGHCNPRVVQAVTDQLATFNSHTRYLHENLVSYVERLASKFSAVSLMRNSLNAGSLAVPTGDEGLEVKLALAQLVQEALLESFSLERRINFQFSSSRATYASSPAVSQPLLQFPSVPSMGFAGSVQSACVRARHSPSVPSTGLSVPVQSLSSRARHFSFSNTGPSP